MTAKDFTTCMAYLEVGINQPLPKNRAEIYWDLLNDLPIDVLRTAAKRVLLEHQWATFPSVAQLRQAASDTILGQVAELPPAEAWAQAWKAVTRIDPEVSGPYMMRDKEGVMRQYPSQTAAIMDSLPFLVAKTINAYGIRALTHGQEPIGVVRGQFLKMFDQITTKHKKLALMPPALKREIEQQNKGTLSAPVQQALGQIGLER